MENPPEQVRTGLLGPFGQRPPLLRAPQQTLGKTRNAVADDAGTVALAQQSRCHPPSDFRPARTTEAGRQTVRRDGRPHRRQDSARAQRDIARVKVLPKQAGVQNMPGSLLRPTGLKLAP